MENFDFRNLKFKLKHAPRSRSYRLSIRNGSLSISSPKKLTDAEALALIEKHADWVTQNLHHLAATDDFAAREFSFCGEDYSLEFTEQADFLVEETAYNKVLLVNKSAQGLETLGKWLRRGAKSFLTKELKRAAAEVNLNVLRMHVRDQSTRWGSCSSNGTISLNWRLALAPKPVAVYVIWHELAHMIHPNHSKDFWRQVGQWDPHYREHRRWLKQNSSSLYWI